MATPSPESATPTPTLVPPVPAGPRCAACGDIAVVHWLRRPTDDELAELVAAEQSRREQARLLADPQQPAPEFGPLPTGGDTTITVYACSPHAITLEAASRTHQPACTAPNDDGIDGCDCTPEPHPEPTPAPAEEAAHPVSSLPAHWLVGGD